MTPSQYFKLPIIGIIKTTILNVKNIENDNEFSFPSTLYDVIAEEETYYVVNIWYKEHNKTPQLISKNMVDGCLIPIDNNNI